MVEPENKKEIENNGQAQPETGTETPNAGTPAQQAQDSKPVTEAVAAHQTESPKPRVTVQDGDEPVAEMAPSPELQSALDEAMKSLEKSAEKKKKEDEKPRPSEEELKLKVEIIDLRHKVRQLEQEVEKKAKEVKQNYDQGIMLKNQLDAYKSRVMKEKSEWFNYGHEPLLKELLNVLDNFERALAHAQESTELQGFKEGVELIARQLMQLMERYGVKQIQALKQTFDPTYHEAMSQVISAEHPDNTVIEEHSRGYMLKDRLLRPSRVTICRNPEATRAPEPPGPEPAAGAESEPPSQAGEACDAEDKSQTGINPESKKSEDS